MDRSLTRKVTMHYLESPRFGKAIMVEPSDNCRPNGDPLLCGAEWRQDKTDEYSETQCCILSQGHPRKHVTRTGLVF